MELYSGMDSSISVGEQGSWDIEEDLTLFLNGESSIVNPSQVTGRFTIKGSGPVFLDFIFSVS